MQNFLWFRLKLERFFSICPDINISIFFHRSIIQNVYLHFEWLRLWMHREPIYLPVTFEILKTLPKYRIGTVEHPVSLLVLIFTQNADANTHELFIFDWHNQSKRRGYVYAYVYTWRWAEMVFFDLFGHFFIAYNAMDFISRRLSGGKRTQAIYLWCCCCCTPLFFFFG